jgi:hypothetical protein
VYMETSVFNATETVCFCVDTPLGSNLRSILLLKPRLNGATTEHVTYSVSRAVFTVLEWKNKHVLVEVT